MQENYPKPVSQLLTLGNKERKYNRSDWPDYIKDTGISLGDVPYLIKILSDPSLVNSDIEGPHIWAPVHAWRTLGQLRATEAIGALLDLIAIDPNDEWVMEELPKVLAMIGPDILTPLSKYLDDYSQNTEASATASSSLHQLALTFPETRNQCVAVLSRRLSFFQEVDPLLNGFIIGDLMSLNAVESIEPIRKAFAADKVDLSICGDVEDVEIKMGLRQTRATPPPKFGWYRNDVFDDSDEEEQLWIPKTPKIGRNDPCPCQSGKKYKKCCLP